MDSVTLQSGVFVVTIIKTSNLNFKTYLIAHRYTIRLLLRIERRLSSTQNKVPTQVTLQNIDKSLPV